MTYGRCAPPAAVTNPHGCIHVAVPQCCIMQPCTMWYVDESQQVHLPSILSRLAALATSSRLLRDLSSGSAIFLLWLCLFTPGPFLLRSSLYSSQKQSPPPRLPSLTFSTCPDFSSFSTRTCTCINKAVVSRTEIYLTLILPLPRSPPFVPPGYGREEPNLCDAA